LCLNHLLINILLFSILAKRNPNLFSIQHSGSTNSLVFHMDLKKVSAIS
jgi:hypothetical protein